MIQTLLVAAPVALWTMAAIYSILFFLFLKLAQGEPKHPLPLLMAGVAFGLCYDAIVLGLGAFLGDTVLLKVLSYPRYILHGAMIPLLIPICAYALEADRKVIKAVGVVTAALSVFGAYTGVRTSLKALDFAGITRFIADNDLTPKWVGTLMPILSTLPTLVLIVCGIVLWKKKGRKELTLAGLFMLFFSAIGPATGHMAESFLFSMFGELGLMLWFWKFAKQDT